MPRFQDDPPGVPLEYVGRLGRTWFIDTNIAGDESPAVRELFELRAEGWVRLVKADMLDTELAFDEDQERRARLQVTVADVEELLGPLVWGHSRWDHSVWGSEHDQMQINGVFALLFPHKERTSASDNDVRDALHVATALRYGADGLLTHDKAQLKRDAAFREVHNGFSIRRPEDVLPFIHRLIDRDTHRRAPSGDSGSAILVAMADSVHGRDWANPAEHPDWPAMSLPSGLADELKAQGLVRRADTLEARAGQLSHGADLLGPLVFLVGPASAMVTLLGGEPNLRTVLAAVRAWLRSNPETPDKRRTVAARGPGGLIKVEMDQEPDEEAIAALIIQVLRNPDEGGQEPSE